MSIKIFEKFIVNVGVTGWVCQDCKLSATSLLGRLEAVIAQLPGELATVKCELNNLKLVKPEPSAVHNNNTTLPDTDARTTLIVHRRLH